MRRRRGKEGGRRVMSRNRMTVFFGSGGGGGVRSQGRRASSNKSRSLKKKCTPFEAAPRRLSSPRPRDCKMEDASSRSSARAEAHEGWKKGKRGGEAQMFRRKTDEDARFFFSSLSSSSSRKSIHRLHRHLSLFLSLAHHCLFCSSSRIPKTSGSASTRGVSASGKTPSIFATVFLFSKKKKEKERTRGGSVFFFRLCPFRRLKRAKVFFRSFLFPSFCFTRASSRTRLLRRSRPRRCTGNRCSLPPRLP